MIYPIFLPARIVGLSRDVSKHSRIGKSCLLCIASCTCSYPRFDDYVNDHQSLHFKHGLVSRISLCRDFLIVKLHIINSWYLNILVEKVPPGHELVLDTDGSLPV